MSFVAFNPPVQSFAFGKIITFGPIAAMTGQNKNCVPDHPSNDCYLFCI